MHFCSKLDTWKWLAAPVVLLLDVVGNKMGAQVRGDRVKAAHVHNLYTVRRGLVMVFPDCACNPGHLACQPQSSDTSAWHGAFFLAMMHAKCSLMPVNH